MKVESQNNLFPNFNCSFAKLSDWNIESLGISSKLSISFGNFEFIFLYKDDLIESKEGDLIPLSTDIDLNNFGICIEKGSLEFWISLFIFFLVSSFIVEVCFVIWLCSFEKLIIWLFLINIKALQEAVVLYWTHLNTFVPSFLYKLN